jgi:hypothetical protein
VGTDRGRVQRGYCRFPINHPRIHTRPRVGISLRTLRVTNWMTLLESLRIWRRREKPVSGPPRTILQLERTAPRVPAEYLSLYTYLEHRYASIVVLTFEQMEALLGFGLPASACTEPDWWMGAAVPPHWYSAAWTEAGRTATPNLVARTVTFERPA